MGQSLAEPYSGYNTYGYPGLIDTPSALSRPDAELAFTSSYFKNQSRNTITFQITPRLSGSFRYSNIENFQREGSELFDRSFSLQYRLIDENPDTWQPAVAVGLNDFLGTGIYSSEYVVATKTLGSGVRVTGGLGWGRLAGVGGFDNPLGVFSDAMKTRPTRDFGKGGTVEADQFFRGNAAFFGGIEWQATEKLAITAEYSSDAYPFEDGSAFERKSPYNFGVSYQYRPGITLGAHYLYGSEFGVQATFATNPKSPSGGPGIDRAPMPVLPRRNAASLGWSVDSIGETRVQNRIQAALAQSGLKLHGFSASGRSIRIEVENATYPNMAQVVGRTARALTHSVPTGVDTFTIVPVVAGLSGAAVTLNRSDLEELEYTYDNSWSSFARASIEPDTGPLSPISGRYPQFEWQLRPYLTPSLFDPDDPIRVDVGLELAAKYQPAPGFELRGAVRKKLAGNLDESTRASTSVLEKVRSDFNIYDREGDPAITELVGAYYFKPGEDLYGRVTAGYLEPMFGGISTELLWKPIDSPFALGAELNYVKQRDFDQLFGFRDYEVATGHVSGYWDMGNGFHSQLDVGRYLAGDWGTTFTLDREFKNGWKVGAFATFTDVSFDDFGEGSFDKGLRFEIPISTVTGQPNTDKLTYTMRPVQRDGGARLNVSDRLYETVRELHKPELQNGWGRFWK
ncbi:YjbH domain-containing protein [Marivita geojedonensis]|uniref:YjbH domain-containing protein n=1 Tax=Marivita geojedonensis TaxID=1123756 RepID=UPI001302E0F0|nr:YjbH domain-containing protein [Marivita geojedonensis]